MGRIRGLLTQRSSVSLTRKLALDTIQHTTTVLVDFSGLDEGHGDAQGTLVVISIDYIEDYKQKIPRAKMQFKAEEMTHKFEVSRRKVVGLKK